MPTLAQLNADAARARNLLTTANTGFGAPSQIAANFGDTTLTTQRSSKPNIAAFDFNRGLNLTPSASFPSGVGVSGTVTRFGIAPTARNLQALAGARTGGGSRTGGATGSVNVQQSRSDIQPQLEDLLSQIIASGGTPEAKAGQAQRTQATQALGQTVQDLSVANATALAQGLVDDVIRTTLDQLIPQLQASGEGAGASRSALDSLQLNDIAARTAEKAATATIQAITGLTGVQASAGQVVERLTASDPISEQLISLITRTPTENQQSSGSVDILNALGLLPKDLDPELLQTLLSNNAPQFQG